MAWIMKDLNGDELISDCKPERGKKIGWGFWNHGRPNYIKLPTGSIEKLIGRSLSWEDNAVEIK